MTTTLAKQNVPVLRSTETQERTSLAIFPGVEGGKPVEALCRYGPDGAIKAMQVRVPVNKDEGHIWILPSWKKEDGKFIKVETPILTAIGYDRINTVVGIQQIVPETVLDDEGRVRPNPYIHRKHGSASAEIIFIKYRMIGVGRAANGNMTRYDLTLEYNLATYFAQDLWSKWTGKKEENPKAWGILLRTGEKLQVEQMVHKGERWRPYDMHGDNTLWINLADKEVINMLGEHITRQKFAERNANTITWRNILRKFFSAAKLVPDDKGKFSVPVVAWITTDADALKAATMVRGPSQDLAPTEPQRLIVEDVTETAKVDKDDADAAIYGQADEDMSETIEEDDEVQAEPASVAATQSPPKNEAREKLRAAIRSAYAKLPLGDAERIIADAGFEGLTEVARSGDDQMLANARKALEDAVLVAVNAAAKAKGPKKNDQGLL